MWLPPTIDNASWVAWGRWDEPALHPGAAGTLLPSRNYTLAETPLWAKAGAVLPTRGVESAYVAVADPLVWLVVPGAGAGAGEVYEDDGVSTAHRVGNQEVQASSSDSGSSSSSSAVTTIAHAWTRADGASSGATWSATVSAANGTFDGMPASRSQCVALKGVRVLPAAAACDDGLPLRHTAPGAAPGFWLEPDAAPDVRAAGAPSPASLVIACGSLATDQPHTITATFA